MNLALFFSRYQGTYASVWRRVRKWHYRRLSNAGNVEGAPVIVQPTLMAGPGYIRFGENVKIGVIDAPGYYSTYTLLNARKKEARIIFGNNVVINNHFSIIAEGEGAVIGDGTIIGTDVTIMDTDFHNTDPDKRKSPGYETGQVIIGENVWIGNSVIILKGTKVGSDSIIAAGSVVNSDIPAGVIAGGIPCKIIKPLY